MFYVVLARHAVLPVPMIKALPAIDWNHLVRENAVGVALAWAANFWRHYPQEHRGVLIYDRLGLHEAGGAVMLLLCVGSLGCELDVNEVVGIAQDIVVYSQHSVL